MSFFDFFRTNKNIVGGDIAYYGLSDWWLNHLTEEQRKTILKTYQPLGAPERSLIAGSILSSSRSRLAFLSTLATWFKNPQMYELAIIIIKEAEKYIAEAEDILDIHFHYQNKLEIHYRNRETGVGVLNNAIKAAEEQIAISKQAAKAFSKTVGFIDRPLPGHRGFEQLAIIKYKQADYNAVIELSVRAKKEGWAGSWDNRLEKAKAKLAKSILT